MTTMTPRDFYRIRKAVLRVTQAELGEMLSYKTRQIQRFEQGEAEIPDCVALAMSWLATFGADDPFADDWRPPFKNP